MAFILKYSVTGPVPEVSVSFKAGRWKWVTVVAWNCADGGSVTATGTNVEATACEAWRCRYAKKAGEEMVRR